MVRKFSNIIYRILQTLDKIFYFLTKRQFILWFSDFISESSYCDVLIKNKKISFFYPNTLTKWRVDTLFTKEPETLEWIESFSKNKKNIFWDIGANIGLYSIYSSIANANLKIVSFEPSPNNLRILTRNISINNLEDRIIIYPIPLTSQKNIFLKMSESSFIEGGALNTFGETFDFEGNEIVAQNKYTTLGTSIDHLIKEKILDQPNYIKIDVDGIEHLILMGAEKVLKSKSLISLSIEINENFKDQYKQVISLMKKNGFIVKHKKQTDFIEFSTAFSNSFNYIFERN